MSKQEFLDKLRLALNGRITPQEVSEHIAYYEEYISTQVRLGKSESEVMSMLGEPRLIAKTIIGTSATEQDTITVEDNYRTDQNPYQQENSDRGAWLKKLPMWAWGIIGFLIFGLIIVIIFSVLSFLLPFLIPVLVILFLIKLFRDWLN